MLTRSTILTLFSTCFLFYISNAEEDFEKKHTYRNYKALDTTKPISYQYLINQLSFDSTLNKFSRQKNNFSNQVSSLLQHSSIYHLQQQMFSFKNRLSINPNESLNNPVSFSGASVENNAYIDTSFMGSNNIYYQNFLNINSDWSLWGIPVQIDIQSQYSTDLSNASQYTTSIRFDKDEYLQQLKKKMSAKINAETLLKNMEDPLKGLKQSASQALQRDIKTINTKYDDIIDDSKLFVNTEDVFKNGVTRLRSNISKERSNTEMLKDAEGIINAMKQKQILGEKVDEKILDSANLVLKKSQAEKELLAKVQEHKKRWDSSGVIKKINELEIIKRNKANDLLNNPSFIRSNAKQMLSLSGIQKFFLNVNRLNIGRDVVSLSPMSLQHFMHTGISTEFINKASKTLLLVAGKQTDFNSIQDLSFSESLFSNAGNVRAGRFGFGGKGKSQSQVSVSSFNQTMSNGINIQALAMQEFRRVLVTTVSQQFNVGQNGTVNIDLSKSAVSYNGDVARADSSLAPKGNFSKIFSTDDFWSNTAIYVKYSGEDNDKGLSYQVNFNKTANGYSNPGNGFLNGGSAELGTRLRKHFLKKKVQVGLRTNLRDYKFGTENSTRWRNVYVVLDARMKLKNGNNVTLRYQPNRMLKKEDGKSELVTLMDRLSVESNINRRFGKFRYNNYLTLAYQKNIFSMSANERLSNTSLQLNALQNFVIAKENFFANLNYSYSDNKSGYVYFNSSANIDAGYNYMIWKKIAASSGFVYASVHDWYTQFGLRQTLSGQLNEKIFVHFYIDVRKNTRMIQTMWSKPVRGELTFSYKIR